MVTSPQAGSVVVVDGEQTALHSLRLMPLPVLDLTHLPAVHTNLMVNGLQPQHIPALVPLVLAVALRPHTEI